jgi:hypothetical protein
VLEERKGVCVCVYKKMVNCRMGLTKTVGGFLCSGFLKTVDRYVGFGYGRILYCASSKVYNFFYANLKRFPALIIHS